MHQRLLRFLAGGACAVTALSNKSGFLLEREEGRRMPATREALADLLRQGWARLDGQTLTLTPSGSEAAVEFMSGSDCLGEQRRDLSTEPIVVDGERQTVLINNNESPIAALARRRTKSGAPFLDAGQFRAGERLRSDYSRAMILPRVGANWEAHVSSGRRDGGRGVADLTDAALGARRRVEAAVAAVGPELAGVLIDVCCFLKGLERVEAERGWPARSGKIILRAGLSALSRHYEPPTRANGRRILQWGTEDYRPINAM